MLGSNLAAEIGERYKIFGTYRSHPNPALKDQLKIDLTDFGKVRGMADSVNPDFVVHCAAITNVDMCEENYTLAHITNAVATENLISSFNAKTKFIYISSDSVFDGKRGNYSETDTPSPVNNYAKSKLEGEHFVEKLSGNYVVIRTNLFGWNRVKNLSFAEWIYKSLLQEKPIRMFTDVTFSPIFATTLSSLIDILLNIDYVGRLNIGSSNSINKYNFGLYLAKLFNFDTSLIAPVSVDSFEFKAKRPKNTSLNVSKAKGIFGSLPTIEGELAKFYNTRSA